MRPETLNSTATTEAELMVVQPLDAAQEIRECHEQVMAGARKTVEHAVRIGELLAGVKVGLKHGEYQKWIALNCPFSERTARNYVRVYQRRDILKAANVAVLTDAYGILARIRPKTTTEASDALNEEKSSEISEPKWWQRRGVSGKAQGQGLWTLAFASSWQTGHFASAIWKVLSAFARIASRPHELVFEVHPSGDAMP
jgi:Protein of unknown function (DUF3102)